MSRWTIETLRDVATERGETIPLNREVESMLLAHERMKGRTEEDYPHDKAKHDLERMINTLTTPIPPHQPKEYSGLKELREYVDDYLKQRAIEREKARAERDKGKVPTPSPSKEREEDRER